MAPRSTRHDDPAGRSDVGVASRLERPTIAFLRAGHPQRRRLFTAGILLGLGLGGFVDGIVLHQILQWHHMVSHVTPTTTVAGLEINTLADGLFHAGAWLVTLVGVVMLWRVRRDADGPLPLRMLGGLLITGWGIFNLVEGIVDHHLLQIHHVREVPNPLPYDLAFLGLSVLLVIGGWWLVRSGERKAAETV